MQEVYIIKKVVEERTVQTDSNQRDIYCWSATASEALMGSDFCGERRQGEWKGFCTEYAGTRDSDREGLYLWHVSLCCQAVGLIYFSLIWFNLIDFDFENFDWILVVLAAFAITWDGLCLNWFMLFWQIYPYIYSLETLYYYYDFAKIWFKQCIIWSPIILIMVFYI